MIIWDTREDSIGIYRASWGPETHIQLCTGRQREKGEFNPPDPQQLKHWTPEKPSVGFLVVVVAAAWCSMSTTIVCVFKLSCVYVRLPRCLYSCELTKLNS